MEEKAIMRLKSRARQAGQFTANDAHDAEYQHHCQCFGLVENQHQ